MRYSILITLFLLNACNVPERKGIATKTGIVGELYFDDVQDRYYDVDLERVNEFEKSVGTINPDNFSGRFKQKVLMVKEIYRMGFQHLPSIILLTGDDSLHTVILSTVEFEKTKVIDKLELQKNGRKVVASIEGERVARNVFRSKRILRLETKVGLTLESHKDFEFPNASR
jgi:hypothetical protein